MLFGAIGGAIIGLIMWLVWAAQAKKTSTVQALGPNPALRETIEVAMTPDQILGKMKQAGDVRHQVEPESEPTAILVRRKTDSSSYGYAFLIRTVPTSDPSRTQLLIHVAPLANIQKRIVAGHYNQFRAYLDKALAS